MIKNTYKKRLSIITLFLAALALAFSSFSPVFAEEENEEKPEKPSVWLQLSPVSNRVLLTPSGDNPPVYTFSVDNVGSETFRYKLYAAPYSVTDETYEINFTQDTPRTQISRWISFKREDDSFGDTASFEIKPGEKQTVTYQIAVPDNIPEGGQYATIFAEPDIDASDANLSGIKTVSRVGLVIYGHTEGDTDDSAEITYFKLTNFLTEGNIATGALIKNNGNTDFSAEATLTVKKFFGSVVYEKTRNYDVFPDTSRRISMEWDDTPVFGIFHVTSSINALDQNYTETKLVLIVPIFMIIIAIILLTIMVIWLIILIKKRRSQKAKLIV